VLRRAAGSERRKVTKIDINIKKLANLKSQRRSHKFKK
jgi:hypothetical protein